jgi:hypothetical protein
LVRSIRSAVAEAMRTSPSRLASAMFWTHPDDVEGLPTLHGELFKRCIHRPHGNGLENSVSFVSVPKQSIRRTWHPIGF